MKHHVTMHPVLQLVIHKCKFSRTSHELQIVPSVNVLMPEVRKISL